MNRRHGSDMCIAKLNGPSARGGLGNKFHPTPTAMSRLSSPLRHFPPFAVVRDSCQIRYATKYAGSTSLLEWCKTQSRERPACCVLMSLTDWSIVIRKSTQATWFAVALSQSQFRRILNDHGHDFGTKYVGSTSLLLLELSEVSKLNAWNGLKTNTILWSCYQGKVSHRFGQYPAATSTNLARLCSARSTTALEKAVSLVPSFSFQNFCRYTCACMTWLLRTSTSNTEKILNLWRCTQWLARRAVYFQWWEY